MYKNLLSWLTVLVLFPSCSKTPPNISVVCEENNVGNCIIKWETAPLIHGQVKVYASANPELIPETMPIAAAPISEGKMVIVTDDPSRRYYYTMVFNNKYRVKVATRNINIPGIQNFRDLGGYRSSTTGKNVRWGMLYRSAQIDSLGCAARRELRNMGIRTIIDLRTPEELNNYPQIQKGFNVVHIPIATGNMEKVLQGIQEGKIKGDTINRIVERMNRELVINYRDEYKNYLNFCSIAVIIRPSSTVLPAKDVRALLLHSCSATLGVNEDIIMQDYRLSNDYFNIPKASKYAYKLPVNSQEAITTVYTAKEDFLNAAKEEIERTYSDIPTYLRKGLGLTAENIEKLQNIML